MDRVHHNILPIQIDSITQKLTILEKITEYNIQKLTILENWLSHENWIYKKDDYKTCYII